MPYSNIFAYCTVIFPLKLQAQSTSCNRIKYALINISFWVGVFVFVFVLVFGGFLVSCQRRTFDYWIIGLSLDYDVIYVHAVFSHCRC